MLINLQIMHNDSAKLANVKWAKVQSESALERVMNTFDASINVGRGEVVMDMRELRKSLIEEEQAILLFGQEAVDELEDSIVCIYF